MEEQGVVRLGTAYEPLHRVDLLKTYMLSVYASEVPKERKEEKDEKGSTHNVILRRNLARIARVVGEHYNIIFFVSKSICHNWSAVGCKYSGVEKGGREGGSVLTHDKILDISGIVDTSTQLCALAYIVDADLQKSKQKI
jgi:hypothetical protein